MLNKKIKPFIAFLILGVLIYSFRNTQGSAPEYLIASGVVIIFWFLLGLKLGLSNLWNILILTLIFGTLIYVFRVIVPFKGPVATVGIFANFDLDPAKVRFLKESHEIALELHFDKEPALEQRYYKIGDLLYTSDGIHYSNKQQRTDLSKLPRTFAWVNSNLIDHKLDDDTAQVKSWFVKSMTYTLSPGILNSSMPLDQFLFDSRAGFCEHFAAAFSTILQLKGYKSRIAFGYAGGTWNPIFKILTYENADAHAWVEVFDKNINQYKIIDPTSWVFPGVATGRTTGGDYGWILLTGLFCFFSFRIFFVRKLGAIELFMQKVSRIEKKHGLESKGRTLSERILKIASCEEVKQEKILASLKIYLTMYTLSKIVPQQDRTLRKSLRSW